MQNAPIHKFWGPLFDYFEDITIFMIWGSVDDDDDDSPGYPLPPSQRMQEHKTSRGWILTGTSLGSKNHPH